MPRIRNTHPMRRDQWFAFMAVLLVNRESRLAASNFERSAFKQAAFSGVFCGDSALRSQTPGNIPEIFQQKPLQGEVAMRIMRFPG